MTDGVSQANGKRSGRMEQVGPITQGRAGGAGEDGWHGTSSGFGWLILKHSGWVCGISGFRKLT